MRWRNGAWRIQVYAGEKDDGRPRWEYRSVHAPNTRAGRHKAEAQARMLYDSIQRRGGSAPGSVAELIDRWIEHRSPDWAPRAARDTKAELERRVLDPIGGHATRTAHRG